MDILVYIHTYRRRQDANLSIISKYSIKNKHNIKKLLLNKEENELCLFLF